MYRQEKGFTIVELLITMVIFLIVMIAVSNIFTGLLTQYKQQSRIAESNIEGIIGFEIIRYDMGHGGYGLPWVIPVTVTSVSGSPYLEAPAGTYSAYNDAPNAPRAFVMGNGSGVNGSDVLVVKAANIARNTVCTKSTNLLVGNVKTTWTPDCENVNKNADCTTNNNVRIITVSPGSTTANSRTLVVSSADPARWYATYGVTANFAPPDATQTNIIYGLALDGDGGALRMPFNRADYYIADSTMTTIPTQCATGTGVLLKNVLSQTDGVRSDSLPILDCVADMQVVFGLDMNDNGVVGTYATPAAVADAPSEAEITGGVTLATVQATLNDAASLRSRLKEVRMYVLAHEGQRDPNFTYGTNPVSVGADVGVGRNFDFAANGIVNWQNYRWKVYTLVVNPGNLR